jgi:hypothetical protein
MNSRVSIGSAVAGVFLWFGATAAASAEAPKADPKMYFAIEDLDRGPFMMEQETLQLEVGAGDVGVGIRAHDQWSNWWWVNMRVPEGQKLAPGFYPDVGCGHGRIARLEVTLDNPACMRFGKALGGWFTIRQLERKPDGTLDKFEAVFLMTPGEWGKKGLLGTVRYNAYPLYITLKSSGDSRWGHLDRNIHGDEGIFKLAGSGSEFEYEASIPHDSWILRVQAPTGQKLKVGTYATTPAATAATVGMTVFERQADHVSNLLPKCGEDFGDAPGPGTLKVRKVRYDSAGNIEGLHASFEFRCQSTSGLDTKPVRGDIRINI